MKYLIAVLLAMCCTAAAGQDRGVKPGAGCRKSLTVDEFLVPDDAIAAKQAFETFRSALLSENRTQVLAMMHFPADLVLEGRGTKIKTPPELEDNYDKFFTPYVVDSVRDQDPDQLVAGWEGVSLSNGAVRFARAEGGSFQIVDITPRPIQLDKDLPDFLKHRSTCPPVVVEGRIVAYNWVTHKMPGFENIYIDHFIVEVTNIVSGTLPDHRIRVDFWGVSHLPEYNLPKRVFEPGTVWRMYLRPADEPPVDSEVCRKDVQETISFVDEAGREVEKESAITALTGEGFLTYAGLPCFEIRRQLLIAEPAESAKPPIHF